ncbi:hypothetical protein PYCCODRAFT_457287 [Trametes coccinea BRFM310]|uniref:Uncharacterized protein n=1 Tax=Trametes coccinea (strain BRFM310) TaxID=1353009 RepID=A0A1Y2ILB2_TRAC3|nr:hypothetical protein PYCCODRAFT_457287 [Trametes coccinea BRFM310]
MSSSPPEPVDSPVRRPSLTSRRSNSVPFPSSTTEGQLKESGSSSSALTSSDKLSALPSQSPPVFDRLRTPSRAIKRSIDPSASFTSVDSTSGSLPALQSFHSISGTGPSRLGESDSSIGNDTPRQRNESERSLPTTLQNLRQAVTGRLVQHSDSAIPSPSLRSRDGSARGQVSHSQPASRQDVPDNS